MSNDERMNEIARLRETILKEYPRLSENSHFKFKCHPGVSCFNDCCGDVNIFLTPYDIIRLKNSLGISSAEFLEKYTLSPFDKNLKYPVVLLKMNDDEKKSCPFVSAEGCRVYNDRPWSCRMYPLGLAAPGETSQELDNEFYFLLKESVCRGFDEDHEQTVSEWLADQGIQDYNRMGEYFKDLTLHEYFRGEHILPPEKIEMFFTACYNIDTFRDKIFNSSFFEKFEIDDETKKKIKEDDVELMIFAFQWLRFALFNEPTMKIKSDILSARQEELKAKGKLEK